MTQISSIPLSSASSAMIWSTGLVRPSRSTSGSMAFCAVSKAGYCLAPRPAAVMTALVICTSDRPFFDRPLLFPSLIRSDVAGRYDVAPRPHHNVGEPAKPRPIPLQESDNLPTMNPERQPRCLDKAVWGGYELNTQPQAVGDVAQLVRAPAC